MSGKIFVCVSGCMDGQSCFLTVPDDEEVRPKYCPFNRGDERWWEIEHMEIAKEAAELLKSIIGEKIETLKYKAAFLAELLNQVETVADELREADS